MQILIARYSFLEITMTWYPKTLSTMVLYFNCSWNDDPFCCYKLQVFWWVWHFCTYSIHLEPTSSTPFSHFPCFSAPLFVKQNVVETKGRTLEEIECMLQYLKHMAGHDNPHKSHIMIHQMKTCSNLYECFNKFVKKRSNWNEIGWKSCDLEITITLWKA
jgi:hypothetical protein